MTRPGDVPASAVAVASALPSLLLRALPSARRMSASASPPSAGTVHTVSVASLACALTSIWMSRGPMTRSPSVPVETSVALTSMSCHPDHAPSVPVRKRAVPTA